MHANDATGLLTLAQIHPVRIAFAVPQALVGELRRGQGRGQRGQRLQVDALAGDGRTVLARGELDFIDNQIDAATRTLLCKAVFPNADEALWPGAFVTVRLRLATLAQAVMVPTTALQNDATGRHVYVVDAESRAHLRQVETAAEDGGATVIVHGLQAGERVVTEGRFRIEDGTRVDLLPEQAASAASS